MEERKYCILYNPFSQNGNGEKKAKELKEKIVSCEFADITKIKSYADFFKEHPDDNIVICGGDGTINRFINDIDGLEFENNIFYYASGSGNDFWRDTEANEGKLVNVDKYIKSLPTCTVKGKDYKFINGIGYGIDGYCCEVGDKLRAEKPNTDINYTSIAIKGLLFHYKPTNATVTVDGVEYKFEKVWLAPSMIGRFYGGGMMPTPEQDRFNESGDLSIMIFHGTGKIRTLMIFPSIFKGKHVSKKKAVTILTGKEITVEFDSPRALQVDGETILDVKKYSVKSAKLVKEKTEAEATV